MRRLSFIPSVFEPINLKDVTGAIREVNEAEKIELYCQNPICKNALIKEGEEVTIIGEYLTHKNSLCEELCMKADAMDYNIPLRSSVLTHTSYDKAKELARKGKIKFSKLEKTSGVGGMGQ